MKKIIYLLGLVFTTIYCVVVGLPLLVLGTLLVIVGNKAKDQYIKKYGWNILITVDQLINTSTGGDPDETISSRTEKYKRKGQIWAICLSKFLDLFDKDHTKRVVEENEGDEEVLK